jgi:hypothetical protein
MPSEGGSVDEKNEENEKPAAERRQRLDLRDIFDDVRARVEPFCQAGSASLEYWAAQAIREAYPNLDEQGLQIVVRSALRVCRASATGGKG